MENRTCRPSRWGVALLATLAFLTTPAAIAALSLNTGDIATKLPSLDMLAGLLASKIPDPGAYAAAAAAWGDAPSLRQFVFEYSAANAAQLKAALAANNVPVLSFVESTAVIALAKPDVAIKVAQAAPGVKLGAYSAQDAIAPELKTLWDKLADSGSRRLLADGTGSPASRILDLVATRGSKYGLRVDVVPSLAAAALAAVQQHWPGALAAKAAGMGACAPEIEVPRLATGLPLADVYETAIVYVCEKDILTAAQWLANQPPVRWVAPLMSATKLDGPATILMQTGDITTAQFNNPVPVTRPYWNAGIMGQNEIVGIMDTGLAVDDCWFQDPRYPNYYKNALTGTSGTVKNPNHRKVVAYTLAPGAQPIDADGHGTFCSGNIAGAILSDPNNADSPIQYDQGTGSAPAAKLAFNDIDDSDHFPNDAYNGILMVNKKTGANITSVSWGKSYAYNYDADCRNYDLFHWQNNNMVAFLAAGNDGTLPTLFKTVVASPAHSKNVVAVGATYRTPTTKNNMAEFSSWGPAKDGRYKPDVSAPGADIISARSVDMAPGYYPIYNSTAGPQCTLVQASGTSFATPLTAGASALMRNYLRDGFYPTGSKTDAAASPFVPSGMLLKALIIGGAKSMQGGLNQKKKTLGAPPDKWQGFGRVNLAGALPLQGLTPANFRLQLVDMDSFSSASNAAKVYTGLTTTGTGPITVVLCWFDYPADVNAKKALVNDLDLEVKIGTKTVKGNTLESATTSTADRLNTVERVLFNAPAANQAITVTVKVFALPSALKTPAEPPQRFAVAVMGHFTGTLQTSFNPAWAKANP